MKRIPYINLIKQFREQKTEIVKIVNKVFSSGQYILGPEVEKFEKNISNFFGVKYCTALNSGTDALTLALYLSGIKRGDEVITTPNSFIASTASIIHLGAIPIFIDVLNNQNIDPDKIEKAISKKTKAIMPVHLAGRPCRMDRIMQISKKYNLKVIEDSAQAIGTKFKNKLVGTFGEFGCFSAHPLKNLNASGDSGFLITNNKKYNVMSKLLRNHGIKSRKSVSFFGYVSRMDNLQAGILNLRLKKLKKVINKRRSNAKIYFKTLKNLKHIQLPFEKKYEFNTYHTFVIRAKKRNTLKKFLKNNGIETTIHYPYLINKQKPFLNLKTRKIDYSFDNANKLTKEILTLPINQYLKKDEIYYICEKIKSFYSK